LHLVAYPSPRWLIFSAIICIVAYLATIPMPRDHGHLTGSDGMYYFSILRSSVLDGDLDFSNDYQLLGIDAPVTITGHKANPYAVGAAILWLPFFLCAHFVAMAMNAAGVASVSTTGVGNLYEGAICFATVIYALIGMWLSYLVIRRADIGDKSSAVAAILAIWWASNVLYYVIVEPSMTHGLTIFSVALFLFLWYPPQQERSFVQWALLALSAAIVTLTRWQDSVIVLLPLAEFGWRAWRNKEPRIQLAAKGIMFALVFVVGLLPQLIMWKIVYGHYLTIPQGSEFMQWLDPHPWRVLFSSRHGLLSWHPIFALPLLGLWPLYKTNKVLAVAVLAMFVCALYVNSATVDWGGGDAYGSRRFISLVPFLLLPVTSFIAMLKSEGILRRERIACVVLVLIGWNALCVLQYRYGGIDRGGDLTAKQMTIDRLLMPITILKKYAKNTTQGSLTPSGILLSGPIPIRTYNVATNITPGGSL